MDKWSPSHNHGSYGNININADNLPFHPRLSDFRLHIGVSNLNQQKVDFVFSKVKPVHTIHKSTACKTSIV